MSNDIPEVIIEQHIVWRDKEGRMVKAADLFDFQEEEEEDE